MSYEQIVVETRGRVGIIKLNLPDKLNADRLNHAGGAFSAAGRVEFGR